MNGLRPVPADCAGCQSYRAAWNRIFVATLVVLSTGLLVLFWRPDLIIVSCFPVVAAVRRGGGAGLV